MKRGNQNQFFSTRSVLITGESLIKSACISGGNWLLMFMIVASCVDLISRADEPVFTNIPANGLGSVRALAVSGNRLYVGFVRLLQGSPSDRLIGQWDGKAWSSLGAELQGSGVLTMAAAGTNLFVGGSFITSDGLATNLAVWNGTQWSPLGSGLHDVYLGVPAVVSMALMGGDLYVGGWFNTAGGLPATNIAKWNGSTWSAVGTGIPFMIGAMAVSDNNLFVGGQAQSIARWDGTNWSTLGSGPGDLVTAIAVTGNTVYATGQFGIGRWDGTAWSPLGSGLTLNSLCLSCEPRALAIVGTDLYVAGQFTAAGGVPANGFAKWDGTQWTGINLGVSNQPAALAVVGTNLLYVGGPFNGLGNQYLLRGALSPLPFSLAIADSSNNTATITWPSDTNTLIQQTVDLGSTNWVVPSETVNDNGVNRSILIDTSGGQRFFRLRKP